MSVIMAILNPLCVVVACLPWYRMYHEQRRLADALMKAIVEADELEIAKIRAQEAILAFLPKKSRDKVLGK